MVKRAIPYFGKDNNFIREDILKSEELEVKEMTLYDLVHKEDLSSTIVIVDNEWLVWLRDIVFNYRDKKCYIPYWKFDIMPLDKNLVKRDVYQYLIEKYGTFYLRYNYEYKELYLSMGTEISLFNLNTYERYKVKITEYINEDKFSIEKLYNLYLNSCYKSDNLTETRQKGYYYIDKFYRKLYNKELKLRLDLGIPTYKNRIVLNDYRDVREFTYDELVIATGIIFDIKDYAIRRLEFESYIYCILRKQIISDNEMFNKQFKELGKSKRYIKYGDSVKLIIKEYWLNNHGIFKYQTWMRF